MISFTKHIPLIRQRDAMQCGVASLAMIAAKYGIQAHVDALEEYCPAGKEGVNFLGIAKGAEAIGLKATAMLLHLTNLDHQNLPLILHWNQNHFVVLYRISKKFYYIADPAKGYIKYTKDEFLRHWGSRSDGRGIAMSFEQNSQPSPSAFYTRKKPIWSFIIDYLKKYRKYFVNLFVGLLVGCGLQLVIPFLTQSIVDKGINNSDIGFVWLVLIGQLMIIIGRTAIDYIRRWILLHISMRINLKLVSDFFIKLFGLPMNFFESKQLGDLLQRIGDHSRVQSFLTGQVLSILFSLISFIVLGSVLLVYNSSVFIAFVIGSALYGVWIASFLHRRRLLDYELFEQQAINQNRTYQLISLMQEIKLQNCEKRRRQEWEDTQADLFMIQMKSLKLKQSQEAGSIFINEIKNIVITVMAASAVIDGSITFGAMLAIQYIIGQLNSPISQFVGFAYDIQDLQLSLERINEVRHRRDENSPNKKHNNPPTEPTDIVLDNVVFRYDRNSSVNTIDCISLIIPKGKLTAIVGESGSGKTTLIKLLLGYYNLNSGSIYIGDSQLQDLNIKEWRKCCGSVMQDGAIFSESIARNIATPDGPIDPIRLESASRLAMIHDYILSLPLGYDTKIGAEGRGLSQGQRQRLLIARAIYRNPYFIFLDEATNSLDAENERAIVENLSEFYKNMTVVIVAHRLSTVKDAHQIVVLEKGRIAEIGTHSNLSAARGKYYNLIKNQLDFAK